MTALKYNCHVVVGYPEKVDVTEKWPADPEYYNSAIVVDGDGETVENYRKTFLYYTDETWALEGNGGFYEGYIPGLGRTAIGICKSHGLPPHVTCIPGWLLIQLRRYGHQVSNVPIPIIWESCVSNTSCQPLQVRGTMGCLRVRLPRCGIRVECCHRFHGLVDARGRTNLHAETTRARPGHSDVLDQPI